MTRLEAAMSTWATQLAGAARRNLSVDWNDSTQAVALPRLNIDLIDKLLAGEPVAWSDLVDGDDGQFELVADRVAAVRSETGAHGLTLVVGTVRFEQDDVRLPVVTIQLDVRRRARKLADWDFTVDGSIEVCAVTKEALQLDFGILLPQPDRGAGIASLITDLIADLPSDVEVDQRCGLAVHNSGWLDVLRDLQTFPLLSECRLVGAVAGSNEQRNEVRASGQEPTTSMVTVLPADSSQLDVVRRAVAGQSLVVEGPPGTGKSQTIANTLAELVGQGSRVLFVAQKRAAVEVVADRLSEIGLDQLVLDIHDDQRSIAVPSEREASPHEGTGSAVAPDLERSRRHHAAVDEMLDVAADTIRLRHDRLPVVDPLTARRLHEQLSSLRHAATALKRELSVLEQDSVAIDGRQLLQLVDVRSQVAALAQSMSTFDHPDMAFANALTALDLAVQVGGLAGVIRSDAKLDAARSTRASVTTGTFTNAALREAMAARFARLVSDLQQIGITFSPGSTFEALQKWAGRQAHNPPIEAAVVEKLSDVQLDGAPIRSASATRVAKALVGLAGSVASIENAYQSLAALDAAGLLVPVLQHSEPATAIGAIVGRSLLADSGVRPARELDDEAALAATTLQRARAARSNTLVETAQTLGRLRDSAAAQAVELEGLLRKSRGRRLTARSVVSAGLDTVLSKFPIVIASPWSVARVLPQQADAFDVVVFDEASQLETSTAVPALARARHALVFGDSFQLPPNTFFRPDSEVVTDPVLGQASLLDAFATMLTSTDRTTMLRWHYRSSDERLIEFVGRSPLFYAGRLIMSPSPPGSTPPIELVRANVDVAQSVIAALAAVQQGRSIAVVTLGVELARVLERAIAVSGLDLPPDFVVRSVEQFQGDERDVIVLVLPESNEDVSPLQALGPINQIGGERRLNVALTRARDRMIVISTFGSRDLRGASSLGALALADFLSGLERGERVPSKTDTVDDVRDIVDEIATILGDAGIDVETLPERSAASVRLVATAAGRHPVAVDVETRGLCRMQPVDREVVRSSELQRRGWRICRTTIKEWVDDSDQIVESIRQYLTDDTAEGAEHE